MGVAMFSKALKIGLQAAGCILVTPAVDHKPTTRVWGEMQIWIVMEEKQKSTMSIWQTYIGKEDGTGGCIKKETRASTMALHVSRFVRK